jgi:hypothetical protein
LFAELFGVGGAGLARGFGEPRGKGLLVLAGAYACRVARVVEFDGRRDERAQDGKIAEVTIWWRPLPSGVQMQGHLAGLLGMQPWELLTDME